MRPNVQGLQAGGTITAGAPCCQAGLLAFVAHYRHQLLRSALVDLVIILVTAGICGGIAVGLFFLLEATSNASGNDGALEIASVAALSAGFIVAGGAVSLAGFLIRTGNWPTTEAWYDWRSRPCRHTRSTPPARNDFLV